MDLAELKKRYEQGSEDHKLALIQRAEKGQNPTSFWMACMDSGNSPNTLLKYVPGEIFVHRTPGGFIPPYSDTSEVADMLETAFSVAVASGTTSYNILPHTQCGAAKALSDGKPSSSLYLSLAKDAVKDAVTIAGTTDADALSAEIERQFAISSLKNIREYPSLKDGLETGRFTANAFLHNIAERKLMRVDPDTYELKEL